MVEEAVETGHEVTAIARRQGSLENSPAHHKVYGNTKELDFLKNVLTDVEVVFFAIGPNMRGKRQDKSTPVADTLKAISQVLTNSSTRIVLIGTPSIIDRGVDKKNWVFTASTFAAKYFMPHAYRDIVATGQVLEESEMDWTVVRFLNPNIKSDGHGYDYVFGNQKPKWSISRRNVARFMVHEAVKPKFIKKMPIVFNK